LKELKMTLAERFDTWAQQHKQEGRQQGWQEGRQEGRQEGESLLLQRLLARRFGVLPADVLQQISEAKPGQLEAWCDRVLDAKTLGDVFH
jgi:flagellar biosynthesis/type III secretory pathway protein FliH